MPEEIKATEVLAADNTVKDTTLLTETPPGDDKQSTAGDVDKTQVEDNTKTGEGDKDKVPTPPGIEFKVPEGVELDAEVLTVIKENAKDSVTAQKLVDTYAASEKKAVAAFAEEVAKQRQTWRNQLKTDKEFGGKNFDQTMADARAILNHPKVKSKDLNDFLNGSGAGDHPEVVKAFARIGSMLREDSVKGTVRPGERSASTKEQRQAARYPSMQGKE